MYCQSSDGHLLYLATPDSYQEPFNAKKAMTHCIISMPGTIWCPKGPLHLEELIPCSVFIYNRWDHLPAS